MGLELTGQLVHVFRTPVGERKETGEKYGGQDKIQLLAERFLKNGEQKYELVSLTVDDAKGFEGKTGASVTVPVDIFAQGNNVHYFIPAGQSSKAKVKG